MVLVTRGRLDKHVLPAFGGRDIKSITPRDILLHVRSIQEKTPNQGARVRTLLSQIFRYAIAAGLVDWDPADQVRGALLPLPPEQHRATITDAASAAALRFTATPSKFVDQRVHKRWRSVVNFIYQIAPSEHRFHFFLTF